MVSQQYIWALFKVKGFQKQKLIVYFSLDFLVDQIQFCFLMTAQNCKFSETLINFKVLMFKNFFSPTVLKKYEIISI